MNDPLFLPASFFIIRASVFPAKDFQSSTWIEDLLEFARNNHQFREAILVATPLLHHGLQKKPIKDPEKIANSLLFYAARTANRATPFGLFSFVATGHWSDRTTIEFNSSDLIKRTRPDMEWVWALVQKHYNENLKETNLTLQLNPLAQLKGDRIHLDYFRYGGIKDTINQSISIHAAELPLAILSSAQEPISLESLCQSIQDQIPDLEKEKLEKVILELFEKQFLIPSAIPSLLDFSLSHLPFNDLKPLLKKIEEYDKLPLGDGEESILKIQEQMKSTVEASSYLQTDLACKSAAFSLSKNIVNEVAKALEILWKLSANLSRNNPLKDYHNLFKERYGTYRTVPLLELINEDQGIGPWENTLVEQESAFDQLWRKWVHHKLQDCLQGKRNEIHITTDLIDDLLKLSKEPPPDYSEALPSFDVFCKIMTSSQKELDQGNYKVAISGIVPEGGSSLGRFLDILGENAIQNLKTFLKYEESTEPNGHFVELSYWPNQARSANVAIHPCLREYVLDLEQKTQNVNSLRLQDIFVGATLDRLYLTDKEGKEEIIIRVGNLLTKERCPKSLRLLRQITDQKYKSFHPLFSGKEFSNIIFFPRICFKKIILAPARWYLDGYTFAGKSKEEIIKKFDLWANEWNLPQHPLLVQGDNQILIDRGHPAYIKKIVSFLKKGEKIEFAENLTSDWIVGEEGNHVGEIVIPFVKNKIHKKNEQISRPFHPVSFEQRWHVPGDGWLFIKVYLGNEGIDRFLLEHLSAFLENISAPWFFIRYRDPDPHLRVRVFTSNDEERVSIRSNFEKVSKFWMEIGLIRNIVFTSYEREIERYGGVELIEDIEKLFCSDSLSTLHILQAIESKPDIFVTPIIHILSVLYFLKGFHLNNHQILSLLSKNAKNEKLLKGYREYKPVLNTLIPQINDPNTTTAEHAHLREAHLFSKNAKEKFLAKAQSFSQNQSFEIIDSLLHMHCNRLMGDNQKESKARSLAYKALIDLENRPGAP